MYKNELTIVVPVFNSEPYLQGFFDCLARQTLGQFSVIFVYDKSLDNTRPVLDKFLALYAKFFSCTILEKPFKEGVGKARDFAIDSGLIDTKYVLFLDSDDSFEPSFLSELYSTAEKTNADIVMCGFDRKDVETGGILSTEMVHNPSEITDLEKSSIIPYLNPAPWNKLYRFDKISDARFVCRGGGEDEMFLLKVLPKCQKIAFINKVLYHYLIHAGSVLSGTNFNLYLNAKTGYKNVVDFYEAHGENFSKFWPLCEACIFIRFGIGMTTRTCLSSSKQRHQIIQETRRFLYEELPGWQRNRLLSFSTSCKNGIKSLFIWRCRVLYQMNLFSLFVLDYRIFIKLFRRDVKW